MIGLAELALFLLPFLLFAAWRVLLPVLPAAALWGALALVALLALAAAWGLSRPRMGAFDRYAPAELQNGHVAPGHAEPR